MIIIWILLCIVIALLTPLGGGYILAQVFTIPVWMGTVIFAIVFYALTIGLMLLEFNKAPNKD